MPIDFIKIYVQDKKTLNEKYIYELYNFLRSFYSVEDFVKEIEIINIMHDPYIAYYLPHEKKIVVNFKKLSKDVHQYVRKLKIDESQKILALHLCVFHFINHEFKHIVQEKEKTSNPGTVENQLLIISDYLEYYFRKEGILFSKYKIDPIERQAELNSLYDLINICDSLDINILSKEMTNRYLEHAMYGYGKNLDFYPTKAWFFGYIYKTERINELIEDLDQYPLIDSNLQTRLELGLKISSDEYNKLILKKENK